MKENNLIASVALFSELYNNPAYNNIGDTLAEFIKGVVITENKWAVNTTELTNLLEKVYDFKIPESVVRTTVKNRLKHAAIFKDGHYIFNTDIKEKYQKIEHEFNTIREKQNNIAVALIGFINDKRNIATTNEEELEIIENFKNYLLDNGVNDKYSKFISAFVIKNQADDTFTSSLNLIREGIILYQGVRYTADINELGNWKTELTIFLSTEHLFNATGYNGTLYHQIFMDFYDLVKEINNGSKLKNGEKLIRLQYLQETKDEIDIFFDTAEKIQRRLMPLDIARTAMKSILEGCSSASDIRLKKARFETSLKGMGIALREFKQSIYEYHEYVVEDEGILDELKKLAESRNRPFDENLCRQFFKIFTKVNYFRGGDSKMRFENVGYIFLTGNRFALHLAHHHKVKFGEDDIPFAKDIDYITNKFWFRLNKGFSNKDELPKSFDVVTKAQVILSAQLNQSVHQLYDKLQIQVKNGTLSKEEALILVGDLRQKPTKPEELTQETIDTSLDFLNNEEYFEDLHRQKEKQLNDFKELERQNVELKEELSKKNEIERKLQLEEEQALKRELDEENFSENWRLYKKQKYKALRYFLLIEFLTFLPIITGILLKVIKPLNEWIESIGNNQYWIWGILALIALVELSGRAYFFDKEKVKEGRLWFLTIINRAKYNDVKLSLTSAPETE